MSQSWINPSTIDSKNLFRLVLFCRSLFDKKQYLYWVSNFNDIVIDYGFLNGEVDDIQNGFHSSSIMNFYYSIVKRKSRNSNLYNLANEFYKLLMQKI